MSTKCPICSPKCRQCAQKNEVIESLRPQIDFHEKGSDHWRQLFNEQRGGEAFDRIQKIHGEAVKEVAALNLLVKRLKDQVRRLKDSIVIYRLDRNEEGEDQ